ncbi:MAG: tRNA uridine-5-carboxymethylaminomethyl(34) synthesis GTPase MnmE [Candidatus Aminicenantales bacterium]
MDEETIIAISTPLGFSGLGIVRLSGKRALSIAKKLFNPKKNKEIKPRYPTLGNLYNFEEKELFDEAYLTYFPAPHTYTREDMVEISCHGSPVILEEVVRLGLKAGARQANPGEFTLRAYLNGRIDLLQAEAVNDLIHAPSLKQVKISFNQIQGKLSAKASFLRSQIIHLLARIEAGIEFPDEDLRITVKQTEKSLNDSIECLEKLVKSYDLGKALSEGISLAIIGKANVGKSTLFNALLEKERAIVTSYPGTTRDYLRETIKLGDSLFNLIDMAGMGKGHHPAEKEGIKKSRKIAAEAWGTLLVLDASRKESSEDLSLLQKFKDKNSLLLFNKIDLPQKMDVKKIKAQAGSFPSLEISALKKTNLEKLKELIPKIFLPLDQNYDHEVILHLRQKLILEEILSHLGRTKKLIEEGYSEEVYAEEIRKILPLIGQLTGEVRSDEIIEDIFRRFCVGK